MIHSGYNSSLKSWLFLIFVLENVRGKDLFNEVVFLVDFTGLQHKWMIIYIIFLQIKFG